MEIERWRTETLSKGRKSHLTHLWVSLWILVLEEFSVILSWLKNDKLMIKWFNFGLFEIDIVSDPATLTWRAPKLQVLSRLRVKKLKKKVLTLPEN